MADEIIKASKTNKEESGGMINNPIKEVKGSLGGSLGGLFKM